jgi:tight adherence protein B
MAQITSDYSSYDPSIAEKVLCTFVGAATGGIVGYVFYEHVIAILVSAIAAVVYINLYYIKNRTEAVKKRLLLQFRDMLESLSSSVSAGANISSAFLTAQKDMESLHGGDSYIARELRHINESVAINQNLEHLLSDFGKRSCLHEIQSFANVFETCNRLGGDFLEITDMTCQIICDKIEVRQEILTVVSAKKTEQFVMLIMPVIFVLLLKGLGAGIADMSSAMGRISSTIALILFAVSYLISRRILRIEL